MPNNVENNCALLSLPPELRNIIYELVLVESTPVKVNSHPQHLPHYYILSCCIVAHRFYPSKPFVTEPPILHTCRQVRIEATPMFYSQNTFDTECRTASIATWLETLSDQKLCHIRSVKANWRGISVTLASALQRKMMRGSILNTLGAGRGFLRIENVMTPKLYGGDWMCVKAAD